MNRNYSLLLYREEGLCQQKEPCKSMHTPATDDDDDGKMKREQNAIILLFPCVRVRPRIAGLSVRSLVGVCVAAISFVFLQG